MTTDSESGEPYDGSRAPSRTGFARSKLGAIAIAIAVVFVLAFQLWTLRTSNAVWERPSGDRLDYYNLLSRGFLSGHLHMAFDPDPKLLALEDPYPPENRKDIKVLHDASFYKGRYYLYWGPAPALVAFLPFRALTGMDLPQMYVHVAFTWLGFISLSLLFLNFRRDYFPDSKDWIAALTLVALGCGGFTLAVLRRNSVWELPIAAGHGFAMTGLLFAYLGLRSKRPWKKWTISSLFFGLAMASRPTYAVGIAAIMVCFFLGTLIRMGTLRAIWARKPEWFTSAVGFAGPCFLMFLGLLWYNYARFGSPTEFGLKYQMSGANEMASTHFTMRYAAHNFYLYYLSPAQWGRYFPFVQLIPSPTSQPDGYYGMEYTYGMLANIPLTWFTLLAPMGLLVIPGEKRLGYGIATAGFTFFFVGIAVTLLGFWAATQRYMADFAPSFILLGSIGILVCERFFVSVRTLISRPVRVLLGGVVAAAAAFGICVSFQLHGLFKHFSREQFQALAYVCNLPAYAWEKLTGFKHGPIEITIQFPENKRSGTYEPLLMTGWEFYSDQVFIYYLGNNQVRFGIDHVSRGTKVSEPVTYDPTKPHVVRLEMGSFFPPDEHPFFRSVPELTRSSIRNVFRLTFDGVVVQESVQNFYESAPESIRIGSTCYPKSYGAAFTGKVLEVKRPGFIIEEGPRLDGTAVPLRVILPPANPGLAEPLVSTGTPEKPDTFYLRHAGNSRIRFGYEHGVLQWESPEITVDYGKPLELEVELPSLFANESASQDELRFGRLLVRLNSRIVWMMRAPYFPADKNEMVFARAQKRTGVYADAFAGALRGMESKNPVVTPKNDPDAIGMAITFNPAPDLREPLVVWGQTGAADILLVETLPGNRIRFAVDHWGVGMSKSEPIDYNPAEVQNLDVRRTPEGDSGEKRLEITINGTVAWSYRAKFRKVEAKDVAIGINRIGASTCSDTFTGALLQVAF